MTTFEPLEASRAADRSTNGGHTTISSRVCPETIGRKSRKNSRVWSGVLYIFQLAAITFFLMSSPFQFGMKNLIVGVAVPRVQMREPFRRRREQNDKSL